MDCILANRMCVKITLQAWLFKNLPVLSLYLFLPPYVSQLSTSGYRCWIWVFCQSRFMESQTTSVLTNWNLYKWKINFYHINPNRLHLSVITGSSGLINSHSPLPLGDRWQYLVTSMVVTTKGRCHSVAGIYSVGARGATDSFHLQTI